MALTSKSIVKFSLKISTIRNINSLLLTYFHFYVVVFGLPPSCNHPSGASLQGVLSSFMKDRSARSQSVHGYADQTYVPRCCEAYHVASWPPYYPPTLLSSLSSNCYYLNHYKFLLLFITLIFIYQFIKCKLFNDTISILLESLKHHFYSQQPLVSEKWKSCFLRKDQSSSASATSFPSPSPPYSPLISPVITDISICPPFMFNRFPFNHRLERSS